VEGIITIFHPFLWNLPREVSAEARYTWLANVSIASECTLRITLPLNTAKETWVEKCPCVCNGL
jgi:hypothetical protein